MVIIPYPLNERAGRLITLGNFRRALLKQIGSFHSRANKGAADRLKLAGKSPLPSGSNLLDTCRCRRCPSDPELTVDLLRNLRLLLPPR
jgi:hypothetical protein